MGKIIYKVNIDKKPSAIQFVKKIKKRFFGLYTKIEYCYDASDAMYFADDEDMPEENGFTDGNHKFYFSGFNSFIDENIDKRFYVIVDDSGRFYTGDKDKDGMEFSANIDDALIMMTKFISEETLRTLRATRNYKVCIETIYLTISNMLLSPIFIITCESRKTKVIKYFSDIIQNEKIGLADYSYDAREFSYDDAVACYETLREGYKGYFYSIIPRFKKNVKYSDIKDYIKKSHTPRTIVMAFKLNKIQKI